jgi:prophage antirepressor-like protein
MNTQKEIVPFSFGEQIVRTVKIDGEPWFVAKDVCDILEIKNVPDALQNLDEDEKTVLKRSEFSAVTIANTDSHSGEGRAQFINIINESGLYNLIFRSRKPEAKAFHKWITSEVLPAIRKTGQYRAEAAFGEGPLSDKKIDLLLKAFRWGAIDGGQFRALIGISPGDFQLETNPRKTAQGIGFDAALAKDSLRDFIDRCITFEEGTLSAIGAAHEAYIAFHGFGANSVEAGEALSRHVFTRWILETCGDLVREKVARIEGKPVRCFAGMKFQTLEDLAEE